MSRLIDADALKDWLEIVPLTGDGGVDINDLVEHIAEMPSAQPQVKCIAKITLSKEQIQDAVEKAKREILAALPRWMNDNTISREAAIEALDNRFKQHLLKNRFESFEEADGETRLTNNIGISRFRDIHTIAYGGAGDRLSFPAAA